MTIEINSFILVGLLSYLSEKGIVDTAEFRQYCLNSVDLVDYDPATKDQIKAMIMKLPGIGPVE